MGKACVERGDLLRGESGLASLSIVSLKSENIYETFSKIASLTEEDFRLLEMEWLKSGG